MPTPLPHPLLAPGASAVTTALAVLLVAALAAAAGLYIRLRRARPAAGGNEPDADYFRSIVTELPDAVFVLDQGLIRFVNRNALALVGLADPAAVEGQPFAAFFQLRAETAPTEGDAPLAAGEEEALASKMESLVDSVWQRADGSSIPVQFRVRTVAWRQERLLVLVARDVSRLKQLQRDRLQLQEQLLLSQKLEAVGHLAGGIARQFNNLLTGILGNAELILLQRPDKPLLEPLHSVITAAQRAAELTDQLLAFARRGKLRVAGVNLHELLGELESLIRNTFPRNIRVILDLQAAAPTVRGDRNQLYQALMNLAINARDAMPAGGTLLISTAETFVSDDDARQMRLKRAGVHLTLAVSDTGPGIDPRILPHIFEPFFSTKAAGQTGGLGLPMVYGTVQNHGGAIRVETEAGKGATFRIFLPPQAHAVEPAEGSKPGVQKPGRILVLDSEELVALFLNKLLQSRNYEVTVFDDPQPALSFCLGSAAPVDLAILDLSMDETRGRAVFDAIRRIWPRVPVIVTSGYATEDWIQEILGAGAVAYLPKPFQSKDVLETIGAALGRD
jgi:PAS domain S-box-containing protein